MPQDSGSNVKSHQRAVSLFSLGKQAWSGRPSVQTGDNNFEWICNTGSGGSSSPAGSGYNGFVYATTPSGQKSERGDTDQFKQYSLHCRTTSGFVYATTSSFKRSRKGSKKETPKRHVHLGN